jgi:hypothetical protein
MSAAFSFCTIAQDSAGTSFSVRPRTAKYLYIYYEESLKNYLNFKPDEIAIYLLFPTVSDENWIRIWEWFELQKNFFSFQVNT